jgi:NAD(P)-dependent dehydrogenase (short-subunit alcohol dehydrogenase family)
VLAFTAKGVRVELVKGKVAVVTGAASGIGLALSHRFAAAGLDVVMADIEEEPLARAAAAVGDKGVETLAVLTDVSKAEQVDALRDAALDRFGAAHVVCNNAGVASRADPWAGPLSTWEWVFGVNCWGVVHGVRAFLPVLVGQGEGHIVNTASIAGLVPGFGAIYDATKHAVVAITEDLWRDMTLIPMGVGVSVLCPGWVNTRILDAARNWSPELGEVPPDDPLRAPLIRYVERALAEGMTPAAVADAVADAVTGARFWVFPHPEFVEFAAARFATIVEGVDPVLDPEIPGMPPVSVLLAELGLAPPN